jgi:hypothetical protein
MDMERTCTAEVHRQRPQMLSCQETDTSTMANHLVRFLRGRGEGRNLTEPSVFRFVFFFS